VQGEVTYIKILKINYLGKFLSLVTADLDTLFTAVHLPSEEVGKLVFGVALTSLSEQKKVCLGDLWCRGQVVDHLHAVATI
jgi:hypothetical protein